MPTYVYECCECGRRHDVVKHSDYASANEFCPVCEGVNAEPPGYYGHPPMRRIYTPQRIIVRPTGHGLKPGERTSTPGLAFDDFRYEMERGELREDATPVTLSPTELAAFDNPPITIPPDPARDRALHQLVAQHWTEDLSPGVAYNRELAAKAAREHAEAVS